MPKTITIQSVEITIAVRTLAEGLYGLFDRESKTLMSAGMINVKFIKVLEDQLKDKAIETAMLNLKSLDDVDLFVSEYVKQISQLVQKELYQVADMIV